MSGVKGFDIDRMTPARLQRVRAVMGYGATKSHNKADIAAELGLHPHTIKELVRAACLIYDRDRPGHTLYWDSSDGYRLKETNDPAIFAKAKSRRVAALKTEATIVAHQCDVLDGGAGDLDGMRADFNVAHVISSPEVAEWRSRQEKARSRPSLLRRMLGTAA